MNFGDRVKQLRTQKNLTQPQLAQAIGIEQSYLSKLENDKSVPGAEIFQSILRAFEVDVATFLEGIDDKYVNRELRQIPEVANHLSSHLAIRVHSVRRWLFASAIAGVLGLTLFAAGYKQLLVSNQLFTYESLGVLHDDEPEDIFNTGSSGRWLRSRIRTGAIDETRAEKLEADLMLRLKPDYITTSDFRSDAFRVQVHGGFRVYDFKNPGYQEHATNRYLMLAGVLLAFASLFGFIVEMRLRSFKGR